MASKIAAALMAQPKAQPMPQQEPDGDEPQGQPGGLDQLQGELVKMPPDMLAGIIVQLASADPKILDMLMQMIGGGEQGGER